MSLKCVFAIYADRESYTSSAPLDREVMRSLPDVQIRYVNRHELADPKLYNDVHAFLVPGIQGEVSYYPDHISPHKALIQAFIRKGGVYFGQCAGAALAARQVYYKPTWAPHKARNQGLLEIFDGVSLGPPKGIGVDGNDARYFRGLTTADLSTDTFEDGRITKVAYSSGPTFIPNAAQDMVVHARYNDVEGTPPAVISYGYGQGLVMLMGPVPQYGASPPTGVPQLKALDDFMDVVRPHEADRLRFFASLMHRIETHIRKLDRQTLKVCAK